MDDKRSFDRESRLKKHRESRQSKLISERTKQEKTQKVRAAAKELAQRKKAKKHAEELAAWNQSVEGRMYAANTIPNAMVACDSCGEMTVGFRCKECYSELRDGTLPSLGPSRNQIESAACRVVRSSRGLS